MIRSCVASGSDVASALAAVARAATDLDPDADLMALVAQRLAVGLPWDEAWEGVPGRWRAVERALKDSWLRGSSPVSALDAARDAVLVRTERAASSAAATLAVRLTVPLTLCLLPAFVLVAVVPLVAALASSLVGAW